MDISWAANSSWFDFISKICIKIASPSCNSEPSLAPKSRIAPHPRDKQTPGFFKFAHTKHPRPCSITVLHFGWFGVTNLWWTRKTYCHCQPRPFLSPVHTNHVGRCPSLASDRFLSECVRLCTDVRICTALRHCLWILFQRFASANRPPAALGCVWKCCVPHCTQWFCWSFSRF